MFEELEVKIAIITETWSKPTGTFERIKERSMHEKGISMIYRHRSGKKKGGGVMIAAKDTDVELCEYKIRNKNYEIVAARAKILSVGRPVFIFGVYLPPDMKSAEVGAALEMVNEEILKIKTNVRNPIFIIGGDFNRKCMNPAVSDYDDIQELSESPPTRRGARLDLFASNINDSVKECFCASPLSSEDDVDSDHDVLVIKTEVFSGHHFKVVKYKTRIINEESIGRFEERLREVDWERELSWRVTSTDMVERLHEVLGAVLEETMPLKTKARKSTDDPWINDSIRKAIKKRKRIFLVERRGRMWKAEKRRTDELIQKAKENYYDREVEKAKASTGSRLAYAAIRNLQCSDRPKQWSVMDLADGRSGERLVEDLADHFGAITEGSPPIDIEMIPNTFSGGAVTISVEEIEKRLKTSKKPKGIVPGDLPPKVLSRTEGELAAPLKIVFDKILQTFSWPEQWKTEYQSIIPKKKNASTFDQCRNVACTNHFSKVLESFILDRLKGEIRLSDSQYGGVKGCGVEQFLIDTWDHVLSSLEDDSSAVNILSVDFSKAFNRVDHAACLRKMADLGASDESLKMLFAFLDGRKMRVRAGEISSSIRKVTGGAPQGTKLGNFLFCCAIDDIERGNLSGSSPGGADVSADVAAVPEQYRPICSTPIRREDSMDQNRISNPFGLRQKKNIIRDTIIEEYNEEEDESYALVVKYIDDVNVVEKLDLTSASDHYSTKKQQKTVRAKGCEAVISNIKRNSKEVGMIVNSEKTQSICISACNYYDVSSVVNTEDGTIENTKTLKVLGFVFGDRPNVSEHVNYIVTKFNRCSWSMTHLKRAGIKDQPLIEIYACSLRPVIEFCSVVYHSLLTAEQTMRIERLQKRILKIILGFNLSYEEMLEKSGLSSLEERRKEAVLKFAVKMSRSERFESRWFPRWVNEHEVGLRKEKRFIEFHARTSRLYNSQLFHMRRILNENEFPG